jgi:hypothetical protein
VSTQSIGFDIFAKDRASAVFDKVGRKAGETAGFFERHKATIAAGAAVAGAAVAKFGVDSVKAYTDAEAQQRVLEDAYKRFPAMANVSIGALRGQAAALQNVTKFDGDAVNAMQGSLAQYKLNGAQIKELTPLVLDYAAKTGRDLPEAANVVGKAMMGQGRALKDVGINFKDTGTAAGNFDQLMGGLRTQVGGFAEQEGKSAEGQAAILANKFGDLQEKVGEKLLPVIQKMVTWLITAVEWIEKNSSTVQILIGVIGTLAVGLAGLMIIRQVTAAVALFNVVLAANPIGLVIVAIAALAAGLIYAYKNSETFRKIVDTAFKAVASVARWLWNSVYAPFFRFLINGFATVADWIANMLDALGNIPGFGWAKDAAAKMRGAAGAARGLAANIKDIPDANVTVRVGLSGPGVKMLTQSQARRNSTVYYGRASGGPVRPGEVYAVGDNPDGSWNSTTELFVPDTAGKILTQRQLGMGGGGGGVGGGGSSQPIVLQVYLDGRKIQQSQLRTNRVSGG